ncbi:RNA polymerase sigma factor [Nonomuraea sp. NPDC050536]|uniref:RNA polymerase sigma factor n=1 Tax=Nonomuraea sp. NPDC050536 TaxID=3364366 RepID=UPI0037C909D4
MSVPTPLRTDLDRIFDAHFAEIHRYIARRLPADVADDLAAEVFLVALKGGYESSRGEVRPWLYGIATNLIARHRRQGSRTGLARPRSQGDVLGFPARCSCRTRAGLVSRMHGSVRPEGARSAGRRTGQASWSLVGRGIRRHAHPSFAALTPAWDRPSRGFTPGAGRGRPGSGRSGR